jgi:MoxR-like ATPase
MLKVVITYPEREEERAILRQNLELELETVERVVKPEDVLTARKRVREVYMDEKIEHYILDIVSATRTPEKAGLPDLQPLIQYGGSPRATISLALAAKTYAFIKHRGYVIPEDIRAICHDVLRHRIGITYEAEAENVTSEDIITEILNKTEVP